MSAILYSNLYFLAFFVLHNTDIYLYGKRRYDKNKANLDLKPSFTSRSYDLSQDASLNFLNYKTEEMSLPYRVVKRK